MIKLENTVRGRNLRLTGASPRNRLATPLWVIVTAGGWLMAVALWVAR